MSQQTNLNVAPYFDDFNPDNDYYKVLFKPGYPVQARELTTLQSILQNQIEKFGQHFFKEGAKVIPGNTGYNALYYAIQLENNYLGAPVSAYANQLVGAKITGKKSGVTATVDKVLLPQDSERGNLTLYINYLSSSTQNNSTQQFLDGELLTANITITTGLLGNTAISSGEPFASTIANNAAAVGASFNISEGIYFIRGNFVNVNTETLILDQYTNKPNYRVGLYIDEKIVTSDIDEALNDNSQGNNNYAAPGADRLKISVFLFKKNLNDFDDNNFIELATIVNGVIRSKTSSSDYNALSDELARRTYAESGDYVVSPFDVSVKESLNNKRGNRGLFNTGQFTYGGSTPSDNLALYQISPGKAFVRGYEVESISSTFLDVNKPRTTQTLENQSIPYNTGPTLRLNRTYGAPRVGTGNTFVLSLRDERVGSSSTIPAGNEIGLARVYDYRLQSGSYNSSNKNLNEWHISLYDLQTFTNITLNNPSTFTTPTFVKGNNSGATAFLRSSVTVGTALTLYDVKGSFVKNESLSFNGVDYGLVAAAVTSYGISNVKSVYGLVSAASTFNADTIQSTAVNVGIATISASSSGISTVRSTNVLFPGNLVKINDLIQYSDTTRSIDPIYAKVVSVGASTISITGVTAVSGIASGILPSSTLTVTDFKILKTNLESSTDNTLYTSLPKNNISNVDISNATLNIRKNFTVNISGNQLSANVTAGTNETFLPFTEQRYSLVRSDGTVETLTSDRFAFIAGGTQLQIYNLGSNDTGATLTATLQKIKPKAKVKRKNRVNSIVISNSKFNGSGIGGTTLNDGLLYGDYPYGTRVQDDVISLNSPDIIEIHGIYESRDTSDPSAPKVILSSITSPSSTTSELIIGEEIVGQNSDAVAIVAEKLTSSQISFIYKNQNTFKEGETLIFGESKIQAQIVTLDTPSSDISFNYTYNNGQNGSFYDYGYITRKSTVLSPTRKLKVYFSNGYYESTDDGDLTTINSYSTFDYAFELPSIDNIRVSDIIDIRPRVAKYSTTVGGRSPLEFLGRSFNGTNNSSTSTLASDESLITSFSFYLGRIDTIYLTKDGKFQVKYGTPSERPEKPVNIDDALEIVTISLPPYLYLTSQASLQFLDNKRYRMSDIRQLETRIKNLEYYTSLSLLETNTANLFVPDSEGLNRFKSGFFVDNFTSLKAQEDRLDFKNSIDVSNKELRPSHYTTSSSLIEGFDTTDPTADLRFLPVEGINVRKTEDVITLDYAEVEWLKQSFATRSESVTPFLISFWQGTVELTPASDTWVDTVRLEAKVIDAQGNYAETLANASRTLNVDPQTGFAPTVWNSWVTNWTGQNVIQTTRQRSSSNTREWFRASRAIWGVTTDTTFEDTLQEVVDTGVQTRTGVRTVITEQFDRTSVGDRVVNRDIVHYMRSRNIQFISKKLKPLTQIYAFFDGFDVTKYCVPKLLEINMTSGTFQVGETVTGMVRRVGAVSGREDTSATITFRVAQTNHKEGPYNAPTLVYTQNPYNSQTLPSAYSSTSTILNVDTFSLSNSVQGEFSGWVESGMVLVGNNSNAQATITNVRLISDISASLIGSFYIPDPNKNVHPRFETGTKTFTLVNTNNNDQNAASTIAEEAFTSSGTLETVQENIISVRNARIENKQLFEERATSRTTGSQVVNSRVISQTSRSGIIGWYDPLAQSFLVDNESGVFLTRCDVFFRSKDDSDTPVTFQLRTMKGGFPTQNVLPFSEIVLSPEQVRTSADGSVATPIQFKAPVYLEGGKEYCICLASVSTKYSVYISRIGENDLLTQTFISNQPYLGSLFKSQNASTWEASQLEDLKFTLYRADFIENGTVEFYNPPLTEGNKQIAKLLPNSLAFNSKKIRVSLASTINDPDLKFGNTIFQLNASGKGNYVGNAGIATGTLSITNSGIGYTPSSGQYIFNNVSLQTITGKGTGATANISINNGVAIAATIANSGNGYQAGDVLGITTIGLTPVGTNARFTVVSIANTNQLIIDNVQGEFEVGSAKTFGFINSTGISTILNYSLGGNILASEIITETDGLHIKVNHKNHGMYAPDNIVELYNVESDVPPSKLSLQYASDSTGQISVDNASNFTTFEGVGVGTTNPGYLLVNNELISYTSVSGNNIGGTIVRGKNPLTHSVGSLVYKYEINNVSLKRINKIHVLNDATVENPVGLDYYNIKLDMSSDGIDRTTGVGYSNLYIQTTKSAGGYNIRATQNIPYEILTPIVHNTTVRGTSLNAEIRSITGRSISGNEIAFIDNGFESITINKPNYLNSTRLICSQINETAMLDNVPKNKSLNIKLTLGTTNTYLSPVVDTQRVSAIFTTNRVNSVIEDYATDNRVNSISDDPTAFQYISKEINLESPASSIKIILNAHVNSYCDIRALYSIGQNPGFSPIFVPFPGYSNLDSKSQIISVENSNGKPDKFVLPSTSLGFTPQEIDFKEYVFTVDNLSPFRSYRIKLIGTSTNQVYVPRIRDLRVIVLA